VTADGIYGLLRRELPSVVAGGASAVGVAGYGKSDLSASAIVAASGARGFRMTMVIYLKHEIFRKMFKNFLEQVAFERELLMDRPQVGKWQGMPTARARKRLVTLKQP